MGRETKVIKAKTAVSLADALARFLYGKPLSECLGYAQGLTCNKFKSPAHLTVRVEAPVALRTVD